MACSLEFTSDIAQRSSSMSLSDIQHQEVHGLICIGFNPAAISLGISLRESQTPIDIAFLESQAQAAWTPLEGLPRNNHMKANFLSDLITLENPRSNFTFIQFLHQRKLLVEFTNLGSMRSSRGLFEDYLFWCAKQFDSAVRYDTQILSIEPSYSPNRKISGWNITTRNTATGQRCLYTSRRIIINSKLRPYIPARLSHSSLSRSVVHSSQYVARSTELKNFAADNLHIAIVGNSSQAAELFNELYDVYTDRRVTWLVEDTTLEPQAKSNLAVNVNFQTGDHRTIPEIVDSTASSGIIEGALLDKIYEHQYAQSIKQPDQSKWNYQIKLNHAITTAEATASGRIYLTYLEKTTRQSTSDSFDLIVAATGFSRSSHDQILSTLSRDRLLDGPSVTVNAEYLVNLRRNIREPEVALWCMGSVGDIETAVGDGAFKIMSGRSARIANSILNFARAEDETKAGVEAGGSSQNMQAQL